MALEPFVGPWQHFRFLALLHGRTQWTADRPVARLLPAHRAAQTQTRTDSRGIRTRDPSVWAGEDSSCLRPRGHCDRYSSNTWRAIHIVTEISISVHFYSSMAHVMWINNIVTCSCSATNNCGFLITYSIYWITRNTCNYTELPQLQGFHSTQPSITLSSVEW
jgi:hypothetical protein